MSLTESEAAKIDEIARELAYDWEGIAETWHSLEQLADVIDAANENCCGCSWAGDLSQRLRAAAGDVRRERGQAKP